MAIPGWKQAASIGGCGVGAQSKGSDCRYAVTSRWLVVTNGMGITGGFFKNALNE
jgi:hypothetical protein